MDSNNKNSFQSLDALRGIAALSVAYFHFDSSWAGYLAVDFFLVLSGFILSYSYLFRQHPISPKEFICRRIARLYPLHIVTLITFSLAMYWANKSFPEYGVNTSFSFIQQLTLTQNIGLNPWGLSWNYPSWSISVEFWINVIFIFFITKKTPSICLFLIALIGFIFMYNNVQHLDVSSHNYYGWINSGLTRGFCSFFLGILSYRIYLHYQNDSRIEGIASYLEVISITIILSIIFFRDSKLSPTDFFAPILFMLTVPVFAFDKGIIAKVLFRIKYLGHISYSLYLNHITILICTNILMDKYNPSIELKVSAYLISLILLSHLTYRYIELPLQKLARNKLKNLATTCVSTQNPTSTQDFYPIPR